MTPEQMIPPKPSEFLKGEMIGYERDLILTIDRIDRRETDYGKGPKLENIIFWREGILGQCNPKSIALKGLRLNVTQTKALFEMFKGPAGEKDSQHWIGRRVKMSMDMGTMQDGKTFYTIVVRPARREEPPNPWLVDDYGRPLPEHMQPEGFVTGTPVATPEEAGAANEALQSGSVEDPLPF